MGGGNKGGTGSGRQTSKGSARQSNYQTDNNIYDELSDYENMVNEDQIEPDFHIDRAEDAVYVPIPKG
jgi:hypothetical protein